jgi:Immunity protein 26
VIRIGLGDCFAIPLPDGRYAYCQYVRSNETYGYLVKVFAKTTSEELRAADELENVREMFPPVFVGLRDAARSGRWKRIGRLLVPDFVFPRFRYRHGGLSPGTYDDWMLWDGNQHQFIGRLPSDLRSLEDEVVWSAVLLEERIVTGSSPYAKAE